MAEQRNGRVLAEQLRLALDAPPARDENRWVSIAWPQTLSHILSTPYKPEPTMRKFVSRAQTQESPKARVTVAVLDAAEAARMFGVHLSRRGIQPVYLHIENRSELPIQLTLERIDPNYYTPLEAAAANHFSIAKRLSAFGLVGWIFFLPLMLLIPFKLITAYRANRRMDAFFSSQSFHRRPIPPRGVSEGFVFTSIDAGAKVVHVSLLAAGRVLDNAPGGLDEHGNKDVQDFRFTVPVPGIAVDYLRKDFAALATPGELVECDLPMLAKRLGEMPAATSNASQTRSGDPVNLAVVGELETLVGAFVGRWDETEVITLRTCWKTLRSFLLGSQYRYSPVSSLYLFGRSQDIALQRSRRSINERLHLRLWLTPLRYQGKSVWVGQVSRDIGVRFTTKTWNLTTHRVDPDVDEARDYVIEDLRQAGRIEASGYVDGGRPCDSSSPRRNLTGDRYYTDDKRAVILLSTTRINPGVASRS